MADQQWWTDEDRNKVRAHTAGLMGAEDAILDALTPTIERKMREAQVEALQSLEQHFRKMMVAGYNEWIVSGIEGCADAIADRLMCSDLAPVADPPADAPTHNHIAYRFAVCGAPLTSLRTTPGLPDCEVCEAIFETFPVCRHCGFKGAPRDDHTCPCPHPDETCTDHPAPETPGKTREEWAATDTTSVDLDQWPTDPHVIRPTRERAMEDFVHDGDDVLLRRVVTDWAVVEPNPCGHLETVKGCGGCDPGAIEFVLDDGATSWRPYDPATDIAHPHESEH